MYNIAAKLYNDKPEILKCFGHNEKPKYFKFFFNPNNLSSRYPAFTKRIELAKVLKTPQEKYDVIEYFRKQNEINFFLIEVEE